MVRRIPPPSRSSLVRALAALAMAAVCACARSHPLPTLTAEPALAPDDSGAILARTLAPTLWLHPTEPYPLERVVAVQHPERKVIAYYLVYTHDIAARWNPSGDVPDEEVVWVGYDDAGAPTDLWTYWHGTILHADWRGRGPVEVNVQWGKHGSLPRDVNLDDLPKLKSMGLFYGWTWFFPDMLLGKISSPGPSCYCKSRTSYEQYTDAVPLESRLDIVARTSEPAPLLMSAFGGDYAHKVEWPWLKKPHEVSFGGGH